MVARKQVSRKAIFAAALVEAGMTGRGFAREIGVSNTTLMRVLLDPKQSAPVSAKIDAFIGKHLHGDAALGRKASAA